MPEEFVLKALNYGVIGLGAVMLVAAWRILVREQDRDGQPRKGILQFTALFMAFCVFVILVGTFVQLHKEAACVQQEKQLQQVRAELRAMRAYLCDKAVYEVQAVNRQSPGANTDTLGYAIVSLDQSVQRAWLAAGGKSEEMAPCEHLHDVVGH